MIGRPPSSVGTVHESETEVAVFPVNKTPEGADGIVAGIPLIEDHGACPSMVIAATRML